MLEAADWSSDRVIATDVPTPVEALCGDHWQKNRKECKAGVFLGRAAPRPSSGNVPAFDLAWFWLAWYWA